MAAPLVAWHYTTAMGFVGIINAGYIDVSTYDIGSKETPVVWFSSNQRMETTIREIALQRKDGSVLRPRNIQEYRVMGSGLYRIGAPIQSLVRYVDTLKKAKIGLVRRKQLERCAKQVGGNPSEWFSLPHPFPLAQAVLIEQFNGTHWVTFEMIDVQHKLHKEEQDTIPLFESLLASGRSDPRPSKAEGLV